MSFSTGVEDSVASGAEEQTFMWCYSGMDLFVSLEIDPAESMQVDSLASWASSDAPMPIQVLPHASVTPPPDAVEVHNLERKHHLMPRKGSEQGSGSGGEPSGTKVVPGDVDKDVTMPREVPLQESRHLRNDETSREQILREVKKCHEVEDELEECRPVPDVGNREFVGSSPSGVQRYESQRLEEWNTHPDERSGGDDEVNASDSEALCRTFRNGFPAGGNLVRECHSAALGENADEQECASHEHFEGRSRTYETPVVCNENPRRSPQVEEHRWVLMDLNRDPVDQVTGCNEGGTDAGVELGQDSESEVVGQMNQEHDTNSSLETVISRKVPDVETFDVAEISAACQLVKISACGYRKESSEVDLSAREEYGVYNLGFRSASNEGTISNIAENTDKPSLDIDFRDTRNDLQPGPKKRELSPWSHDDRYIPRLARRAKARLRGSRFNTRIDFGNSQIHEESDCEVLQRPPRKRQYKSTQELHCKLN